MEDELKIEGKNPVIEALKSGTAIQKIQIDKRLVSRYGDIIVHARKIGIPVQEVPSLKAKQGILAYIYPVEPKDLKYFFDRKFILLADGIEDPHNLGAIIRTAECAGVDGIIMPKHRSAIISEGLMSSSAGAIFHLPFAVVTNTAQTVDKFLEKGFFILGADPSGEPYFRLEIKFPLLLIIGGEDKGLRPIMKRRCDKLIGIPMVGKITSLNTSVSAGIIIYEIRSREWR
ncbi:MAG: 23S rRNA (guanosine(2251)-2'-O)-methyltransferase RlmB [bacterium]|nr:23S rRNA (guanosine(2251)-2'-O)-methyltransferase RlmB [bacterium]